MVIVSTLYGQQILTTDTAFLRIKNLPNDSNKIKQLAKYGVLNAKVDYEKAISYSTYGLELTKELKFYRLEVKFYHILVESYKSKGDYKTAYKWASKALKKQEENKDFNSIGLTHINLSQLFRIMGNEKMAFFHARNGVNYTQKYNSPHHVALSYGQLAGVFYEFYQDDSALFYFNKNILLAEKNNDQDVAIGALMNSSNIYYDKKEYKEAIALCLKAVKYAEESENFIQLNSSYRQLAYCYIGNKEFLKAEEVINKSIAGTLQYGELRELMDLYKLKSEVLYKKGTFKDAFDYMNKCQELKDSLNKIENIESINELETKYQVDKKIKENELLIQKQKISELSIDAGKRKNVMLVIALVSAGIILLISILFLHNRTQTAKKLAESNEQINKQNTTLTKLNKQLIDSEEELTAADNAKSQLLSIISHDISSPLNAITNYQASFNHSIVNANREDLIQHIEKINNSTQQVYKLVNNLLEYSFTQQKGFAVKKEKHLLFDIINSTTQSLNDLIENKKIVIKNNISTDATIDTDKNLLLIIVRNLISNAIKFSHTNGIIEINWDNNLKKLIIKDYGVGMSDKQIQTVLNHTHSNSMEGTQKEQGTGLGLQIVKLALNHLNSSLEIRSILKQETEFSFILL